MIVATIQSLGEFRLDKRHCFGAPIIIETGFQLSTCRRISHTNTHTHTMNTLLCFCFSFSFWLWFVMNYYDENEIHRKKSGQFLLYFELIIFMSNLFRLMILQNLFETIHFVDQSSGRTVREQNHSIFDGFVNVRLFFCFYIVYSCEQMIIMMNREFAEKPACVSGRSFFFFFDSKAPRERKSIQIQ